MVALGGRMPQIVLNIKRGDSGELSITTSALNLAGERTMGSYDIPLLLCRCMRTSIPCMQTVAGLWTLNSQAAQLLRPGAACCNTGSGVC